MFSAYRSASFDLLLLFLLLAAQLLDGVFTIVGVQHFGPSMEGNPILRGLFPILGEIPAIIGIKLFASLVVVLVWKTIYSFFWVRGALWGVFFVYFSFALLPWSLFLSKVV